MVPKEGESKLTVHAGQSSKRSKRTTTSKKMPGSGADKALDGADDKDEGDQTICKSRAFRVGVRGRRPQEAQEVNQGKGADEVSVDVDCKC